MSPSDQFMAANVVLIVTFLSSPSFFLLKSRLKSYSCTFLWSTEFYLNCYLGCFLVLRKPMILFGVVGID